MIKKKKLYMKLSSGLLIPMSQYKDLEYNWLCRIDIKELTSDDIYDVLNLIAKNLVIKKKKTFIFNIFNEFLFGKELDPVLTDRFFNITYNIVLENYHIQKYYYRNYN